jgi:hypothetical protein
VTFNGAVTQPAMRYFITFACYRSHLHGDESAKLSRDCKGVPMGLRPIKVDEKSAANGGRLDRTRNGRGHNRSGFVEAVKEFDPERAF